MKKVRLLLLIVLVLFTVNVKATSGCETGELKRLKELAKIVEFDYDYKVVDNVANFSIQAYNLHSDLKVMIIEDYYRDKYKEFKDNSSHTATLEGFKSGEKIVITIKGFVNNACSGTTVLTKTIKLPYYNMFYSEKICKGFEDFKYCKELIDTNISEETFDEEFEKYFEEKEIKEPEEVSTNNTWKLLIIICSIVVVVAILVGIMMLIARRRRKNRL